MFELDFKELKNISNKNFDLFQKNSIISVINYDKQKISKTQKIALISHDADADGIVSGALMYNYLCSLRETLPNEDKFEITIFGYNNEYFVNEKNEPWFTTENSKNFDSYVFTDITPPIEWLKNLDESQNVVIIDHHQSFYEAYQKEIVNTKCYVSYLYNNSISASQMVYNIVTNYEQANSFITFPLLCLDYDFEIKNIDGVETIVTLVNEFDVWNWYEKFKSNGNVVPYAFYFGLYEFSEINLHGIYHNSNFKEKIIGFSILFNSDVENFATKLKYAFDNIMKIGVERVQKEMEYSDRKKYSICEDYNGIKVGYYVGQVDFWLNERMIDNDQINMAFSIQLKVPNQIKISARGFNSLSCYDVLNSITNGKSGGHRNSAGGTMTISEYDKFILDLTK